MKQLNIPILFILLGFLLVGCTQSVDEQIKLLNGYWEIAKIENSQGFSKEYSISQNIDFFDVSAQGKGVRKKVQPDIRGNFTTTNASENIDVRTEGTTVTLLYSTAFDSWQEEIISVSEKELILRNEENFTYVYRRYEPLSLD